MRHFIKQCLSFSLCIAMALSFLGTVGYATDSEPKCSCTVKCESGSPNQDCPVCSAQGADLSLCAGTQPEAQCGCTVKCESGSPNQDCPVCSAQGADLSLCAGTQPEAKCSCTVKCQDGSPNPDCPVCSAQGADLSLCAGTQPEAQCSCTVKCESGSPNQDCPVCSAQGTDLSLCAGMQPEAQCSCTVKCLDGSPNPDCPVCSAQGTDLSLCAGTGDEGAPDTVSISSWAWVGDENLTEGKLYLPGLNSLDQESFESVKPLLPSAIKTEGSEETLDVSWAFENLMAGSNEKEFALSASLPQGYILAEEAQPLSLLLVLGGAQTLELKQAIYISGSGDDTNDGSENAPMKSFEAALQNLAVGGTIYLAGDMTMTDALTIPQDTEFTLDLNGHGVTGGIAGALINIASGANVVITDTSGSHGRIYNGGAVTSRAVQMEEGAALSLNGGITLETGSVTSIARSCAPLYITASDANPANVNIINANLVSPSDYAIRLSKSQNAIISIQGGSFSALSKAYNVSCICNGSAAQVRISGGSFTNWATGDSAFVPSDSSILVYDNRVCVQAAAPDSYTARLKGLNCYLMGSELYSLAQRWNLNGNTLSVRGALFCSYPPGKYFGNVNGSALSTTIELESGASLSGSMPLAIADVKVSGGSAPVDFFKPYSENYAVSVSSQDGSTLYSSRIKSEKILAYVIRDGVSYEYTDVTQAINNAKKYAGSTLKLNADYSTGYRISPGISDAFNWTLDLNGHSYTYTSTRTAFQISGSDKSFSVTDSSANGGGQLIISKENANSVIETTGSSSNCHIIIGKGVSVEGNSILITGSNNTLDVYGRVVTGNANAAIQNNGGSTENSTVNLYSGAVVESNSIGVFLPGPGTLNVYGGAQVKGGNTGIELRAGAMNIYDGASVTGGSGTPSSAPNGSGSTTSNAAVAIAQHNTGEAIDVNIYGGSFTGGAAFYESNPQGNAQNALDKIAVEIKGGSFNGSVSSETRTGFISGGTYSLDPDDDYIVSGLDGAAMGSNKYIIVAKGTTPLNIEGVSAVNRDCNGTSVVQLAGGRLVDGSGSTPANVSFELGTGTMADKYAGTGKPVTTAIKLTGDDAAKYTLIQPSNLTVTITCKPVHVELKPATCVSNGVKEHYYCAYCDLYYLDPAASVSVLPAQLTSPATGVHIGDGKWYADSTYHWHKCSACKAELDKGAHQLRLVNYKQPTLFSKGYTGDKVCIVCGYVAHKGQYFTSTSSPITGDDSNLLLWGGLLVLATAGIGGVAVYTVKRKKKK